MDAAALPTREMKTLRDLSDDEQLEALASDPWADIQRRMVAKEHLEAMRRHERWRQKTARDTEILRVLIVLFLTSCVILLGWLMTR